MNRSENSIYLYSISHDTHTVRITQCDYYTKHSQINNRQPNNILTILTGHKLNANEFTSAIIQFRLDLKGFCTQKNVLFVVFCCNIILPFITSVVMFM